MGKLVVLLMLPYVYNRPAISEPSRFLRLQKEI